MIAISATVCDRFSLLIFKIVADARYLNYKDVSLNFPLSFPFAIKHCFFPTPSRGDGGEGGVANADSKYPNCHGL
jgi:hypothetical protein